MFHGCPPSQMLGAGAQPGPRFDIIRGTATACAEGSGGGHYGIYVISDTQILVAVLRQTT
jgi:hypothetical protein